MIADDGVDDDEDDGSRDVDFAPPHNCKFSMLAMAAAAKNARVEDDINNNGGTGASVDWAVNASGKFCVVRRDDECNDDGGTVGAFGTFLQKYPMSLPMPISFYWQPLQLMAASGMMMMHT
jgi:hypothetical protein